MCQNFTSSHKIRFKEFRKKVFKTIDQMTQTKLTRRKYLWILQKMIPRKKKRNKKFARIHISSILVPKCIFNSYYKIKKWKTIREKCIISFFFSSAVLISQILILEISQNKNGVNYASRKFIYLSKVST